MLQINVNSTNTKIEAEKHKFSRDRDIYPTNIDEIRALIGLLYLAGIRKASHLNTTDLWKTDGTGIEVFRLTMTHNKVERQSKKCFSHSHVTLDEKLEAFRGNCSFRQYIQSKPNRYGLKIFALSDAKLFYTSHMEVYVGRNHEAGSYCLDTGTKAVSERACHHLIGSHRNVTTDNWYTSTELGLSLKEKGLTLLGTIKGRRKEIPTIFARNVNRPVGSSMFGFGCGGTLVSYIPKKGKNVLLYSTMHHGDDVDKATGKPDMILMYNSTKSGQYINCAHNIILHVVAEDGQW
ncbi:hypothetical protein NQ314_010971 [Rhamnusium bicolor]|uniref:PiggyBac transposable element-derived protein domain-containing protein n=1 Tax=Rhamnusium bicolor TaxID=1586634 RepID=A0AAV8XLF3_9CUCU|nr:hypothetical protein NQ314_010971 [Rhamnusium bicolor]